MLIGADAIVWTTHALEHDGSLCSCERVTAALESCDEYTGDSFCQANKDFPEAPLKNGDVTPPYSPLITLTSSFSRSPVFSVFIAPLSLAPGRAPWQAMLGVPSRPQTQPNRTRLPVLVVQRKRKMNIL